MKTLTKAPFRMIESINRAVSNHKKELDTIDMILMHLNEAQSLVVDLKDESAEKSNKPEIDENGFFEKCAAQMDETNDFILDQTGKIMRIISELCYSAVQEEYFKLNFNNEKSN